MLAVEGSCIRRRIALLALATLGVVACASGEIGTGDTGADDGGHGEVAGDGADADSDAGPDSDSTDGADGDADGGPCTSYLDCDDGIDCTVDSCDIPSGSCSHEAGDPACSDGNPCTGLERCDLVLGCLDGEPPVCSDGIDCTDDTCDPLDGDCLFSPDHDLCTEPQVCDVAAGGCVDPPDCTVDADCDDHDPCTGVETCTTDLACAPGTRVDCDDFVGCTGDRCQISGSGGAECVHVPPDRDADSYPDDACGGTDCDDLDPLINPGGSESCNAADDDCNGSTDETFECVRGTTAICTTACGSIGARTCSNTCAWGSCSPPAETCNGRDDDCAGGCDNGWECCQGAATSQSCGYCGTQTRTCGALCSWGGWGSCGGEGECAAGTTEVRACACGGTESRACSGSCAWGAWSGCWAGSCTPGAVGSCVTSCGSTGTQTCAGTCTWGSCNPPAETCNGRDDDCVSGCDNGWACCAGTAAGCTNSCGVAGSQTCTGSCTPGGCCAVTEVCGNTCDDNCNGFLNEGCTSTATVNFPISSDPRSAEGGTYFWRAGNYVYGTRTVSLSTVTQAAIHIVIAENYLSCDTDDMRMLINGIEVGRFSVTSGMSTLDRTFSFGTIAGPTYTLRYEVVRTVAGGCGSFSFNYTSSTVTLTGSP